MLEWLSGVKRKSPYPVSTGNVGAHCRKIEELSIDTIYLRIERL
jgi:hypothetical protein